MIALRYGSAATAVVLLILSGCGQSARDQNRADRADCLQQAQEAYGAHFINSQSAKAFLRRHSSSPKQDAKEAYRDCMYQKEAGG